MLGLVTSKTGKLESKDEIKRRVEAAAKFIDIDQLCLSPQCGFASTEEGNLLTEDEQWAKLVAGRRGRRRNLGTFLTLNQGSACKPIPTASKPLMSEAWSGRRNSWPTCASGWSARPSTMPPMSNIWPGRSLMWLPGRRGRSRCRQRRRVFEKLVVSLCHRTSEWSRISRRSERASEADAVSRPRFRAFPRFLRRISARSAGQCRRGLLGRHGPDQLSRPRRRFSATLATSRRRCAAQVLLPGFFPWSLPASVLQGLRDEYYGSEEKLSAALGEALREEYKAITDAGLIVQLDDAWLAAKYDVMVPPARFADYYAWAEQKVAALNRALEGIPGAQSRYHVCWGSWNGPHTNDVAAEDIIDLILQRECRRLFTGDGQSASRARMARVGKGQTCRRERVLLPGVIAHTTNVVEHPKLVAERLCVLPSWSAASG